MPSNVIVCFCRHSWSFYSIEECLCAINCPMFTKLLHTSQPLSLTSYYVLRTDTFTFQKMKKIMELEDVGVEINTDRLF